MIGASPEPQGINNKGSALVLVKVKLHDNFKAIFMHGLNKALELVFRILGVLTVSGSGGKIIALFVAPEIWLKYYTVLVGYLAVFAVYIPA